MEVLAIFTTRKWPIYFLLLLLTVYISLISGNAIVQGVDKCGPLTGIPHNIVPNIQQTVYNVSSHAAQISNPGYKSRQTCLLTVRGQLGNQWLLDVRKIHLDAKAKIDHLRSVPLRCHDYVKIYDGPRADGSRLLTPVTGLCGSSISDLKLSLLRMRTCNNYVTFEFTSDAYDEKFGGFFVMMRQEKWRNRGTLYMKPGLIIAAGSSCIQKEFQANWRYQKLAKGETQVGQVDTHKYKFGTFWCYECNFCKVDYFEPKLYPSAAKAGCYMCLKENYIKKGTARRVCFTERDYTYFMDEIVRQGSDTIKDTSKYTGCFQHTDNKNQVKKLCFCEGDYCNPASSLRLCLSCVLLLIISLSSSLLLLV